MNPSRNHRGALVPLLVATPLTLVFVWSHGIATLGDDSVSYLLLARYFAGDADAILAPWVPLQAHFPPLFPAALAACGAASSYLLSHLVVGAFALLALAVMCLYAGVRFGRGDAGLCLGMVFLVMPTAWLSIKGILSESMYLFTASAALLFHAMRLEGRAGAMREWLVFGALTGAALLTRAAGFALLAACAVHGAVRCRRERRAAPLLPVLVAGLMALAWIVVRPIGSVDTYGATSHALAESWLRDPAFMASAGLRFLFEAWVASFAVEPRISVPVQGVIALIGACALAGAVVRARGNGVDGWYVLFSLGLLETWVFGEENTRRLLYPLVPLMLIHACLAVLVFCDRLGASRYRRAAVLAAVAAPLLLCAPALVLTLQKALDREPIIPGTRYAAADILDSYLTVNTQHARALAAKEAAVLAGLEGLERATPPGARIMWMRPEYVALLGHREGVAFRYRWEDADLVREVRASGADYILLTGLFKTDLEQRTGDMMKRLPAVAEFSRPVMVLRNPVAGGDEFILMEVDREALERKVAASWP